MENCNLGKIWIIYSTKILFAKNIAKSSAKFVYLLLRVTVT